MTYLFIIVALLIIGYLATKLDDSKPLYSDQGIKSKIYADPTLRIKAKPDRIEGDISNAGLLEYKDRAKGIYPSDIAQVYVSVLAARAEGINITSAAVFTNSGQRTEVKLGDQEFILKRIQKPLTAARLVASGVVPEASPKKKKCRSCGYNRVCKFAI